MENDSVNLLKHFIATHDICLETYLDPQYGNLLQLAARFDAKDLVDWLKDLVKYRSDNIQWIDETPCLMIIKDFDLPFQHIAAKYNSVKVLSWVIKKDPSSVNLYDSFNNTPLQYAVAFQNKECVQMLVRQNAYVNAFSKDKQSPLHRAVMYHDCTEIISCLIEHGAFLNPKNIKNETPLFIAVSMGKHEVANFLIKRGANVDIQNNLLQTPLHKAAQDGFTNIVELLISNNANINLKNNLGRKAIDVARCSDVVKIFETRITRKDRKKQKQH